ncbi:MAG: hypothetical protein Ct9H300mP20_17340 [Gammaproteobacteria bacterium]|nr:MAG: hypothetical protein Ct9H300mP20_17340 [Gammaproteobacteria bacterium]
MTTMVWPLLFKSLKISKTWLPVFESKFPVGSSANRMEGEFTNALAIATLCCSPPDSSVGLCVSRLVRPTLSNTSSALISLFLIVLRKHTLVAELHFQVQNF